MQIIKKKTHCVRYCSVQDELGLMQKEKSSLIEKESFLEDKVNVLKQLLDQEAEDKATMDAAHGKATSVNCATSMIDFVELHFIVFLLAFSLSPVSLYLSLLLYSLSRLSSPLIQGRRRGCIDGRSAARQSRYSSQANFGQCCVSKLNTAQCSFNCLCFIF